MTVYVRRGSVAPKLYKLEAKLAEPVKVVSEEYEDEVELLL